MILALSSLIVPAKLLLQPNTPSHGLTSTTVVSCVAYGVPRPTLTWLYDTSTVSGRQNHREIVMNGIHFVTSFLELCPRQEGAKSGQYACQVGNGVANSQGAIMETAAFELCFIGRELPLC